MLLTKIYIKLIETFEHNIYETKTTITNLQKEQTSEIDLIKKSALWLMQPNSY